MVRDFNLGTAQHRHVDCTAVRWVPTGIEGTYQIQVAIKDFVSGETASQTFDSKWLHWWRAAIRCVETANPLVALFSAPSCPAGSTMRVSFQEQTGSVPATTTNWANCHPPTSMTFEIAGMYPKHRVQHVLRDKQRWQHNERTHGNLHDRRLPKNVPMPAFKVETVGTDTTNPVVIHNLIQTGGGKVFPQVATDLSGNIVWYYYPRTRRMARS